MSSSSRLRAAGLALAFSVAIGGVTLAAAPAVAAPAAVEAISAKTLTATKPVISGKATVGSTLTVKTGKWTTGTRLTYQWYVGTKAITGAKGSTYKLGTAFVGKTLTVKVTGTKSGYTTRSMTSAATAKIAYPLRFTPAPGATTCPSWAPIKGNASSKIYHVPGGRDYTKTHPEECFRTAAAAQSAGYRASKV